MGKLDGKLAVVTGASRGIGKGIALRFAQEGADTTIFSRSGDDLDQLARQLQRFDSDVLVVEGDVSQESDVKRLARKTIDAFGQVDVLVNNAGILPESARVGIEETSREDWEKVITIDLTGMFLCTKHFLGPMKQRRQGHIINIASMSGKTAENGLISSYRAAKHGVMGFSKTLAKDVKDHGIAVSVICPGDVDTTLIPGRHEHRDQMLKPADIAEVALFLVTRPSRVAIPEVMVYSRYEI